MNMPYNIMCEIDPPDILTTSYFGNLKNVKYPISISRGTPEWYNGPSYIKLAPTWEMIKFIKHDKKQETYSTVDLSEDVKLKYTDMYYDIILSKLDPYEVLTDLFDFYGGFATVLCWEKPLEFCHRRLFAGWIIESLGISCDELGKLEIKKKCDPLMDSIL